MFSLSTQISLLLTVFISLFIAFITLRSEVRPRSVGGIWVAFNVLVAVWAFAWGVSAFYLEDLAWRWFLMYIANLSAIALPPLFVTFVSGFLGPTRLTRPLLWGAWIFSGTVFATAVALPRQFIADMQHLENAHLPVAGVLLWVFAFQYVFLVALGAGLLAWELPRLRGAARKKVQGVLIACGIGFLGGATTFPPALGIVRTYPYGVILIPIYSLLITYAILHHRFMDIRLVLRDTTLHIATASLLGIACLVLSLPLVELNAYAAVFIGVGLMAFLMVVAYDPIRRAIQPLIDRLMFTNQFAYLEELAQLPNDLLEFSNLRQMLRYLAVRLTDAARLERTRIFMYDPGQQSYIEMMAHAAREEENLRQAPRFLMENDALIQLLRSDDQLWTREDIDHARGGDPKKAQESLRALQGAACFPVMKGNDLLGLVVLGAKRSGEPLNQQDLRILRALRMRLENFLAQAMAITQEAMNLVKDSHDMKNDINALRGRISWRATRLAAWAMDMNAAFERLDAQGREWGSRLEPAERAAFADSLALLRSQCAALSAETKKSLPVEEHAVTRMAHRLRNWAEYGRVVSEGFRGERRMEAVNVGQAARLSIERWRPMAEKKNVSLSAVAPKTLRIWGERSLVEQIIENLIDNALKATEKGGVEVHARLSGRTVEIEVRDTGCGIPEEDLATIFEKPFYQGRGREHLEQSTGVGLYLVSHYAKNLGGSVSAESRVGEGSVFRVSLPAYQVDPKRAEVRA